MDKAWTDLVREVIDELDELDNRDHEIFRKLREWMSSRRDNGRVEKIGDTAASKFRMNRLVFSFGVKDGKIAVWTPNGNPETFSCDDLPKACRRMAEHMAHVVRDPDWENRVEETTAPSPPIYPA